MALQKTVNRELPLGVPGQFYDGSVRRATAYTVASDAEVKRIGCVYTFDGTGTPVLGGTGKFAGICVHPAAYARQGLDASTDLRQGGTVELADMGRIVVLTSANASINASVQYNTATGEIAGDAPETPASGFAVLPGAKFVLYTGVADGLAVVQLDHAAE